MSGTPWFTPSDAEREAGRTTLGPNHVVWKGPAGQSFNLTLPYSVYPPRDDTDLLASVLQRSRLPPGSACLDIGCGSGALSLLASSLGWRVVACDVNPMAVASTRGHARRHGLNVDVREGGPGPTLDGECSQWGGDRTYRLVMWNMPYLQPPDSMHDAHLGPLEEAALVDTDTVGLYSRFVERLAGTNLLAQDGMALVVLSSAGDLPEARSIAWRFGLAAAEVLSQVFEDGERLSVVALWHPYPDAGRLHVASVGSTNAALLAGDEPVGTSLSAGEQTKGRGQHQRSWSSSAGTLEISWVLEVGTKVNHHPHHQVVFGEALVHHLNGALGGGQPPRFCLKWPNDVYVRRTENEWVKCGGILYEMASKGARHRLVVGLGLNATEAPNAEFGTLVQGGLQIGMEDLGVQVNAMVASLHGRPADLSLGFEEPFETVAAACLDGVELLGPLSFRGQTVNRVTLRPSGRLSIDAGNGEVELEDSVDLVWLGLQHGIHRR